jgi:3-oxoacyl-[acyl-carrier-protein] synthase-3
VRAELNPNVCISGVGSYVPPKRVDNKVLEDLVKGYDPALSGDFGAWVDQVCHVHERRFSDPQERASDLAYEAARRALNVAGVDPKDLGLIILATFTPSHDIPGDHCVLAERLGAHRTGSFNLKAACAGSIYALGMAWTSVASGLYDHVLVVGSETISKALNFHDPLTSILFGDGAGAIVVSRRDGSPGGGMFPPYLSFRYSARNIHLGNSNIPIDVASFPEQEIEPGVQMVEQALVEMEGGPNVLRSAVKSMTECVTRCLGYEPQALRQKEPELMKALAGARIVPHQANGRIIDSLGERLGVSRERILRTVYNFGNMSAASNVLALDFALRYGNLDRKLDDEGRVLEVFNRPEERIQAGELVLMPSIGGGYLMGCIGFIAEESLIKAMEADRKLAAAEGAHGLL